MCILASPLLVAGSAAMPATAVQLLQPDWLAGGVIRESVRTKVRRRAESKRSDDDGADPRQSDDAAKEGRVADKSKEGEGTSPKKGKAEKMTSEDEATSPAKKVKVDKLDDSAREDGLDDSKDKKEQDDNSKKGKGNASDDYDGVANKAAPDSEGKKAGKGDSNNEVADSIEVASPATSVVVSFLSTLHIMAAIGAGILVGY